MKSASAKQAQSAVVKPKKVKKVKGPVTPVVHVNKAVRTEANKQKRIERDAKRKAEAAAKKQNRPKKIKDSGNEGGNSDGNVEVKKIEGKIHLPDKRAAELVARWVKKQQRNTNHGDRNV